MATILHLAVLASAALAQTLAQAPPSERSAITAGRSSWAMELIISLAMVGLALFVVCRRSDRQ